MSQKPAASCTVVLPVKQTHIAKSRLASLGEPLRRELALAFAFDAVAAALDAVVVRRVLVVTNDEVGRELAALGADVVPDQPDAGLNPALAFAAQQAKRDDPDTSVLAMSADLPAVRGMSDWRDCVETSTPSTTWKSPARSASATAPPQSWLPCSTAG